MLSVLLRNEFRARYRSQALGILWSLLNPLVQMAILSVIFSHVSAFKSAIPSYPVYLLMGVVVWQWFSTAINTATQSFIANADIVKRTVFSRQIVPMATAMSYGINFAMEAVLVLALVVVWPHAFKLSPALLLVPVILGDSGRAHRRRRAGDERPQRHLSRRRLPRVDGADAALLAVRRSSIRSRSCRAEYLPLYQMNPIASILVGAARLHHGRYLALGADLGGHGRPDVALMLAIGWLIFRHYERMVLDYV